MSRVREYTPSVCVCVVLCCVCWVVCVECMRAWLGGENTIMGHTS